MAAAPLTPDRHEDHDMTTSRPSGSIAPASSGEPSSPAVLALAWLAVGIPLLWGVFMTLKKALALFA
jgi:hypothetical protein